MPVRSERVTTERPPTWLSGRQASQRCLSASTPSRAEVARAEAATAVWVRTTPFDAPVLALVATTRASPSSTGTAPCCLSIPPGVMTQEGRNMSSNRWRAGGARRWSRGATASPASQADLSASTNGKAAGQVYGDEVGHLR